MGSGLGHLTRAVAFLNHLGCAEESTILTGSKFAADSRVVNGFKVITVKDETSSNPTAFREFLNIYLEETSTEEIFIDSFPFGLNYEFVNFPFADCRVSYVARLLDWNGYAKRLPADAKISFDRTFLLEELQLEHQEFVLQTSDRTSVLDFDYPISEPSSDGSRIIEEILRKDNFWLVVHSGPEHEISELVHYADEQRNIENRDVEIVVVTPGEYLLAVEHGSTYNLIPAFVLFPHADRVFTGSGFNIMKQMSAFRYKHEYIPFPRRFDDQYLRAERARLSAV